MPAAIIPAVATVAGAAITANAANDSTPATSGGPYNEQSTTTNSQTHKGWAQAEGALGQIMQGANTLYDPNQQLAEQTQANLGHYAQTALDSSAQSQHTKDAQAYAQNQAQGGGAIGSGDISTYAAGLYNNQAIQDQMRGLEASANRRLQGLVSNSRDSFDSSGTYNSGMARQAENNLRRDTAEALNAAELGFRGSQYNNNMNLAGAALSGNRNDMNQGNTSGVLYGQQGLNNLQGAGNVEQDRLQNQANLDTSNYNNQSQFERDLVADQSALVNPMAQAYGTTTGTQANQTEGVSATSTGPQHNYSPMGAALGQIGQMDFRTDAQKAAAARAAQGIG